MTADQWTTLGASRGAGADDTISLERHMAECDRAFRRGREYGYRRCADSHDALYRVAYQDGVRARQRRMFGSGLLLGAVLGACAAGAVVWWWR